MTNILDTLTAGQLLAVYNHHTDKPLTRFADAKVGRTRLAKLLATIEVPVADAVNAANTWNQRSDAPTPITELDELFQPDFQPAAKPERATFIDAERRAAKKARKPAARPAKAPAKAAKPAKTTKAQAPVETASKAPTGAKATILAMIARKGGVSEKEVCEKLGWAAAGATISRAIKLATFKVVKVKGEDGRTRYCAA
jgi:hypothetical protein